MAYNLKSITAAQPTIDNSTGFVTHWNLTLTVTDDEPEPFIRDYTLVKSIETPSKKPEDYSPSELMGLFPATIETIDKTFEHHKEIAQQNANESQSHINDFDIGNLSPDPAPVEKPKKRVIQSV